MKGPGVRVDLDVRRIWRCPRCGRVARTVGQTVSQRCGCTDEGAWMQLQPPVKREPYRPPAREPIPDDEPPASAAAEAPVSVEPASTAVIVEAAVVETAVVQVEPPPEVVTEPPRSPERPSTPDTEVFGEGIIPPSEPP